MMKSYRFLWGIAVCVVAAGCGGLVPSGRTSSPQPQEQAAGPAAPENESQPSTDTTVAAQPEPAPEPEAVTYDPGPDIEILSSTLQRVKGDVQKNNYQQVTPDLDSLNTLLGYVESHLPSVVVQLGAQRIQVLLDRNDLEGARNATLLLKGEIQSVSKLMAGVDLAPVLDEMAGSLASGDAAKAREALGRVQIPGAATEDPATLIASLRDHLAGASAATGLQQPKGKVALAELADVEELVGSLGESLGVGAEEPTGTTPAAPPTGTQPKTRTSTSPLTRPRTPAAPVTGKAPASGAATTPPSQPQNPANRPIRRAHPVYRPRVSAGGRTGRLPSPAPSTGPASATNPSATPATTVTPSPRPSTM
ncbi:MAG: hypothetical protein HY318_18910 [Armatimonadetes bacterium]|nr:hypothetical protein [Armatimonadota bacterium]